tara:strand:+ start:3032 stop:3646 length:615 start_codon:yes stop_codon:yes gene_type:complete
MKYEVIPAFSIPIGVARIDRKFCDVLKNFQGLYQENAQDIATEADYSVLDKAPEVKKELIKVFSNYINGEILNTPEQEYTMTTSWITHNKVGNSMDRHCHKNAYYSSVLYFDTVVKEHAPLLIENPVRTQDIFVMPKSANIFTIEDYISPIRQGLILFFPSYLYHYHHPFKETNIPRRSLACNYLPIGKYGGFDSSINSRKLYG